MQVLQGPSPRRYYSPIPPIREMCHPTRRFNLPLSQPRTVVEEKLGETAELFAYRFVSGGSSVVGAAHDLGVPVSPMFEFS